MNSANGYCLFVSASAMKINAQLKFTHVQMAFILSYNVGKVSSKLMAKFVDISQCPMLAGMLTRLIMPNGVCDNSLNFLKFPSINCVH